MSSPEVCGGYDDNKRVEGWAWSRIILTQESVALYKSFKTLWSFCFGEMRSPEVCGGYDDNKGVDEVGHEGDPGEGREEAPG
jgi:hypothetical protein